MSVLSFMLAHISAVYIFLLMLAEEHLKFCEQCVTKESFSPIVSAISYLVLCHVTVAQNT